MLDDFVSLCTAWPGYASVRNELVVLVNKVKLANVSHRQKSHQSHSNSWFESLEGRTYYSASLMGPILHPAKELSVATTCTLTVDSTPIHAPYESETFQIHIEPAGAIGAVFLNEGLVGKGNVIDDALLYGTNDGCKSVHRSGSRVFM